MNIICKQQYVREDNEKNMLKNKMTIEHMNLQIRLQRLSDLPDVVNPPC